ncbi:MAG: hypothetical protein U0Q19_02945 [Kineosporiaceae bacterium]
MANPGARSRSAAAPVAVVVAALLAGGLGWYVITRGNDSDQVAVSASPEPAASSPGSTADAAVVEQSPAASTPGATRVPGTPGAVTGRATPSNTRPVTGNLAVDTSRPTVAITSLPPVKVGAGATIGTGVVVTVGTIDWVDVKANGPGEIAGKGAEVQVTIKNTSGAAFDLTSVAVNASYPDGTPVSPNGSPPAKEFTGSLASGDSATAIYLFTLTSGPTDRLNVEVSSGAAPGIAVIKG